VVAALAAMIAMLMLSLLVFFAAIEHSAGNVMFAPQRIALASLGIVVLTVGFVLEFRYVLGDF
jgi:lipopolysaccharide/colanic/teichoic acid biosynthesis glycosyltransferase